MIKENSAAKAFWGRCRIEGAYALFYYTDKWRQPVHLLKYGGNVAVGEYLGKLLGEKIAISTHSNTIIDYIVPIPLHWRKRVKRGYNQSEVIAKGVVKGISNGDTPKILTNILKRTHFTQTQTQKERGDRWLNVSKAFVINKRVAKKYNLEGKHILIIDDVLTTGATIDACVNILQQHFNCRISIATLAYVE